MKATGIVRRIDDLGRVVIPKEIRRTMRIREGDPLEIYTDKDGGVIFKKYSLMGGLADFASQLCETLNRTTGRITVITDRDNCIAVAGVPRRELMDKRISPELERLMEGRQIYQYREGEGSIPLCADESRYDLCVAAPILAEGDVLGCVVFAGMEDEEFDLRAEFGDIFQHGLFSINIFSMVILILGIIGAIVTAVRLLSQPDLMASVLGAAAGIMTAGAIVLSALWDTVKDFIRYYDFRAKRRGDKIYIRYGFLKKVEYTIPVDKIQALKVRQSFVARLGGRYMAEIVNVGMGDDKNERDSFLVLYSTEEKLKERIGLLLPEFAETVGQRTERMPGGAWAAWLTPLAVCCAAAGAGAAVCAEIWQQHASVIMLGAAAFILLVLIGLILKYRTDGVSAEGGFLKLCHGYFGRNYISVRYQNIQYAEIRQGFIARALGIRKGTVHLLASSSNAIHNIPYFKGDAAEKIRRGMLDRN